MNEQPDRRAETRAPDEAWDFAKKATFIVGLGLVSTGAVAGASIVLSHQEPSRVALIFTAGLVLMGALFLKERTMVPIVYRIIDKAGKDTTGPAYEPEDGEL